MSNENVNAPFGLRPVQDGSSGPFNSGTQAYFLPTTSGTNMYIGDPVIIAGSADTDGVPTILIATSGTSARISGVIVGFVPNASVVANGYRVGSTACYALVTTDPNIEYEVQSTTIAAVDIGLNANLNSGTPSSSQKTSGWYLDTATKATTNTLQFRITSVSQRTGNIIGQYAIVRGRINLNTEGPVFSGTGV